jgi:hypothetical protein
MKKQIPKKIRQLVWNKYIGEKFGAGICQCCKITEISQMNFHCGHITSEKNGGDMTLTNLLPICALCNSSMGSINMWDFIKTHGLHKDDTLNLKEEIKRLSKLLEEAKEAGIHEPRDYKKDPAQYCGMKIGDNPYYDV